MSSPLSSGCRASLPSSPNRSSLPNSSATMVRKGSESSASALAHAAAEADDTRALANSSTSSASTPSSARGEHGLLFVCPPSAPPFTAVASGGVFPLGLLLGFGLGLGLGLQFSSDPTSESATESTSSFDSTRRRLFSRLSVTGLDWFLPPMWLRAQQPRPLSSPSTQSLTPSPSTHGTPPRVAPKPSPPLITPRLSPSTNSLSTTTASRSPPTCDEWHPHAYSTWGTILRGSRTTVLDRWLWSRTMDAAAPRHDDIYLVYSDWAEGTRAEHVPPRARVRGGKTEGDGGRRPAGIPGLLPMSPSTSRPPRPYSVPTGVTSLLLVSPPTQEQRQPENEGQVPKRSMETGIFGTYVGEGQVKSGGVVVESSSRCSRPRRMASVNNSPTSQCLLKTKIKT
mmetsp:Transcript_38196/g.114241  ORF Transcript_38196/g.114241 Transcript_38196/m.114241 type:complete len:397 (+) Transcript_38196:3390-4580(+)